MVCKHDLTVIAIDQEGKVEVNQSSERPVRSGSLKLWWINLKQQKYYFFFDSQLIGLIQN